MSKKKDGKIKNFNKLVRETLAYSTNIVGGILREKYRINKNKIPELINIIDKSTTSEMIDKYTFKNSNLYGKSERLKDLEERFREYQDFVDFAYNAFNIMYYQSLGDTLGYYNGNWEFNYGNVHAGPEFANEMIYEFISFGGINDISIKNWFCSDDTILYYETFEVVYDTYINSSDEEIDIDKYGNDLKEAYLNVKNKISDRHPGKVTMDSLDALQNIGWNELPYNSRHIGNGSAMRTGSIGIFFPGKSNRERLIMLAVECSRITHNSAIAILGSVTAALFTAYSLEKIPIELWPSKLLKLLESKIIDEYMMNSRPKDYSRYIQDKVIFVSKWRNYANLRFTGTRPRTDMRFMINPVERYRWLVDNFSKGCDFPGGCADDCLIMAYDAFLQSEGTYEKLIVYAMLHPGDSDTVGSIASSWFGGYYDSIRNQAFLSSKFNELEYNDQFDDNFFDNHVYNLIPIYYRDIYLNIARKYIKQVVQ